VVCASRPHDRPFEEQHERVSITIVAAGTFQYRSALGQELMTPGSLMLGSPGQRFECGHEHGAGDRCISFWYEPDDFERLAVGAGVRASNVAFPVLRLPPLRELSPIVARACAGITGLADVSWDELAAMLAVRTLRLVAGPASRAGDTPPRAVARVSQVVRAMERHELGAGLELRRLARTAGLSPFHFLRTFKRVTGLTPHQYLLRARLREAGRRLTTESGRILDIALDCGFGDVSNFNHTFRSEFGISPRQFRSARQLTSGE
jgi:AraC-like DNA-binding protein